MKERTMKLAVSTGELQKILGVVGGVIPSKSTIPILENFLFELKENKLNITATDLDTSMTVTLTVKGLEDGTMVIPAKRFTETMRALPTTDVTIASSPDGNKITMITSNGEYKLTGEYSDQYPGIPSFEGKDE